MTHYIRKLAVGILLLFGVGATAAEIGSFTEILAATPSLAASIPASRSFVVASAGPVNVTLADLAAPAAMTDLRLVVTRGGNRLFSLNAPGTGQFLAAPGTYDVQVLGTPAANPRSGTFNVEVRAVGGTTALLQFSAGIDAPAAGNPAQSTLQKSVALAQPGTYRLTLGDRSFPAALTGLSVFVVHQGVVVLVQTGPCAIAACSWTFNAPAVGNYDLVVSATAASPALSGLYTLEIAGPGGEVIESAAHRVGQLPAPFPVSLPQAANYTLTLADLAAPQALGGMRGLVVQGASVLAQLQAPGSVAITGAGAGNADLYVLATAGAGGAGAWTARVASIGGQTVFQDARVLPDGFDSGTNTGGYRYATNVATAGSYRFVLKDQLFPSAFVALRALVVQNGGLVQTIASPGTTTLALANGPAFLLVTGVNTSGASSLLGLSLEPAAGGAALLTRSQGVGGSFSTRDVVIPAAGSHDLQVADLSFPAAFQDFAVAITRGTDMVGQIFGGGQIRFEAVPGTYSINLLSRLTAGAQFGTWGFGLATTPPAPTISLTATPASVPSQTSATLTWSTTGATSCTATGGWSGTKALSGTETSIPLIINTAFTLTCVGAGGNANVTANVAIDAPAASDGGGGSLDIASLLLLLMATCAVVFRQSGLQARVLRS
jgi:hypothetical protein